MFLAKPTKSNDMSRVVDLELGVAYVITDLHGEAEPYMRYRDHFLSLHAGGHADFLVILGDLIHGYGNAEDDASLELVLDVIRLQNELGAGAVVMVLGNHEFPHIYGVTLSKGSMEFTSRFESSLGPDRSRVVEFFKSLPFFVRTAGGTLLTHAGAVASVANADIAALITEFSHDKLLAEAERLMSSPDVRDLIGTYMNMTPDEYDSAARHFLAVSGESDPRYLDLLRGLIASNLHEWQMIWDYLFNQCEAGVSQGFYRKVVERYLACYSSNDWPQRAMVTGHIAARNGFEIITNLHLRLASWAHSTPKEAGRYLMFDVAQPVQSAHDLTGQIHALR